MYNRYIPQPDGSYQKRRMQEPRHPDPPKKQHPPKAKPESCPPPILRPEPCPQQKPPECHQRCSKQASCKQDSISGFFKQLLPKDLDTADLLIILLLLLMAGDCEEDRNNALLTLALYFFM